MELNTNLDLLSTSQKISEKLLGEIEFEIEQSHAIQADRCENNAPYICFPDVNRRWHLVQGCCNSWQCPRCGQIRAREEYGRIVEGAKKLREAGHTLYFVTLTCIGKELDVKTSDDAYLMWTNRLLSTWRARTKKDGQYWCYVQVTERQKRGAAHSHMITTCYPNDMKAYKKGSLLPNGSYAKHDCLFSLWFMKKNVSAGLGKMTDCTKIESAVGVAVYVSKYLFKEAQQTLWPKSWKRVRYSQNWPKLEDKSNPDAFPVIRYNDWLKVKALGVAVHADTNDTYEVALARLITNVVPPEK